MSPGEASSRGGRPAGAGGGPPLREPDPPDPSFPRYTACPFPRYRYVPTLNPHPVAHPAGHSYQPPASPPCEGAGGGALSPSYEGGAGGGQAHPPLPPPDRWRDCPEWLYGADLYNYAYWWETHETWEAIWQSSDKSAPPGRFLQGLIQIAAAHLKRHLGQAGAVQRLLDRSRAHLDFVEPRVAPVYMGLDVRTFRAAVSSYFSAENAPYPFVMLL